MPYIIGGEQFSTKEDVKSRCRQILASTDDGQFVEEGQLPFLLGLFHYHDEWQKKAAGGIRAVSTQTTSHGTRCFVLVRYIGEPVDISFPHAIRFLPSSRTVDLLPQALRDFRNASRNAVQTQIFEFRDLTLRYQQKCPYTGEILNRNNCAVDHIYPKTFDGLLFDFCRSQSINPLKVGVGSKSGTVAILLDAELLSGWQDYHQKNANLQLVSKLGNLQLPKLVVPWRELWR